MWPRRDQSTGGGQDSQETGKARKKAYKKNNQGCQYHHYYIHMSHLRQDLWIQDRTIQPPENSPLRVRSGRHHRPRWTTTSMCGCEFMRQCIHFFCVVV